jgi:hypothetical protein
MEKIFNNIMPLTIKIVIITIIVAILLIIIIYKLKLNFFLI